jgi:NAD(P)-dependent dehydrogenase (short-subunit alcohol dehydrogenase family)
MAAIQKVALITAGTAGLGAQIARALAPDFRLVSEVHICEETSMSNQYR